MDNPMKNPMKKLFILFLLLVPLTISALPTQPKIEFFWTQPTTDTTGNPISVAENIIYCGSTSGNYTIVYMLPTPATSVLISDVLPTDGVYYCVATASAMINGLLTESRYSNELGPLDVAGGVIAVVAPGVPGSFGVR